LNFFNSHTVEYLPLVERPIELPSSATLIEGFETLINNNILSAPVYMVDTLEYIGFLDIRDLVSFVVYVYDQQKVTNDSRLGDLIRYGIGQFTTPTTDGVTISYLARRNRFKPVLHTDNLLEVVKLLAKGLHRVPVLGENGRVVNIVSQSTIISLLAKQNFGEGERVSDINIGSSPVKTVNFNTSVISTFRLLDQYKISGVAVVDDDEKMVGVTTGKDLKFFIRNPTRHALEMTIFENIKLIRSEEVEIRSLAISVFGHELLTRAIQLIAATRVHRIFVMDSEKSFKPIRVISISDILKYFIE